MQNDFEIRKLELNYDVDVIRRRYLRLYTALISDVLDSMNINGSTMEGGIYPLIHTMKVAGPAFTVHCVSTPSKDSKVHDLRLAMMKSMTQGCVQVRDTQGNSNCGQFGEISATAARAAGCSGAIIDGSTRDSNYLIDMDFPTLCRFRHPGEAFGRFMAVDFQIPIYVRGVDGMLLVNPGDFLFGDNDGVVVVPKELTVQVLEQAEEWFEGEARSRKAMADGEDPFEVYARYGRF